MYKFVSNEIKPTAKHINDKLASDNALASLLAYKARSLNGIWATALYLHNGFVPTLYDLLLPKKRVDNPEDGEYRPDIFEVGSREFDPEKVGFKNSGYQGFTFVANSYGNSNSGHEFTSGRAPLPTGEVLRSLTKEERLDLLEYLKAL